MGKISTKMSEILGDACNAVRAKCPLRRFWPPPLSTYNCRRLRPERINAYIDGELGQEETEKIASHMRNCSCCRIAVERYQKVAGALDRMEWAQAPDDFPLTVRRAAERRRQTAAPPIIEFPGWYAMSTPARIAASIIVFLGLTAGGLIGHTTYHSGAVIATEAADTEEFVINDRYFDTMPPDDISTTYLAFLDLGENLNDF